MALVGYARVSSAGQSLDVQLNALKAAGCDRVYSEKKSGKGVAQRDELATALEYVREGDTLIVTRIDRLARSLGDLVAIAEELKRKRVDLKALEQPIDTSTAAGKAFFQMLGVFAEFEASIRAERQREGIDRAKAQGVYRGRKATIDPAVIVAARAAGERPVDIARRLGIARSSVYLALGTADGPQT